MATGRLDLPGAVLAALGLAGTTYALIEAPGQGASAVIVVTAVGGLLALVAFFVAERRSANPMLPLEIFSSRQFSAANGVTFVVYAALGGFFFLLVAFLQISIGYTPIEAGAASLPVTFLMLLFSARSGALAQRIGARLPLTVGPLIDRRRAAADDPDRPRRQLPHRDPAAGDRLRPRPHPGRRPGHRDRARRRRHPPLRHRLGDQQRRRPRRRPARGRGPPIVAGLTGDAFYDPAKMTDGFHMAMLVCAVLAALGGILAWLTISAEVLHAEPEPGGDTPERLAEDFSCGVGAPPLRPGREAECELVGAAGAAGSSELGG